MITRRSQTTTLSLLAVAALLWSCTSAPRVDGDSNETEQPDAPADVQQPPAEQITSTSEAHDEALAAKRLEETFREQALDLVRRAWDERVGQPDSDQDTAAVPAVSPRLVREPLSRSEHAVAVLYTTRELFVISAPVSRRASENGDGDLIITLRIDGLVVSSEPVYLDGEETMAAGLALTVRSDTRAEEILVLAADQYEPVILRESLTPLTKAVLRDLDGDSRRERLRYAVVFDPGGFRDVILDASIWTGTTFRNEATLSVLRAIDDRLRQLEAELLEPPDESWSQRANGALIPTDGSPPLSDLLPAFAPVVPPIRELPVELGAEYWLIPYELSVDGFIFRVELTIDANPFSARPVRITNLD